MKQEQLIFFDTTLRDGEQSPGVTLDKEEKIRIAQQLSLLGVDVCEAGFPVASQGDFDSVYAIAKQVGPLTINRKEPMTICALARATNNDILQAFKAIEPAPKKRIHLFLATSDLHLEYKLKLTREECIQKAVASVVYAKSLVEDVEFSCEDAARSDVNFLTLLLPKIIEAGATTLNIPDTVGYMTPTQYGALINHLIQNTHNAAKVVWSCHCHNDLGLATANTLAAIQNGVRQVEVTINGIGERAGNTALEEVAMALHVHKDSMPCFSNINKQEIYKTSILVRTLTGMVVQNNKAIVGKNAFQHESGIHQDGVLKHKQTYEIMNPTLLGIPNNTIVLGKHSGRNALKSRLAELGVVLNNNEQLNELFVRFKKLADSKKSITDDDLIALHTTLSAATTTTQPATDAYHLHSLQIVGGTSALSTVSIELQINGNDVILADAVVGKNGMLSAIFQCVNKLVKDHDTLPVVTLINYQVNSVGDGGGDSIGQVSVQVKSNIGDREMVVGGHATDVDVLIASCLAYLKAISRIKHAITSGNWIRELSNEI